MRNVKFEKSLLGSEWWKGTFTVEIPGDPNAKKFSAGLNEAEREQIVQGWNTVAVLEAEPRDMPFQVGFTSGGYIGTLSSSIETLQGRFGMRVGPDAVGFFSFDPAFRRDVRLRLVEVTREDDPKYQLLPLY